LEKNIFWGKCGLYLLQNMPLGQGLREGLSGKKEASRAIQPLPGMAPERGNEAGRDPYIDVLPADWDG